MLTFLEWVNIETITMHRFSLLDWWVWGWMDNMCCPLQAELAVFLDFSGESASVQRYREL